MTIVPERLALLSTVHLGRGLHNEHSAGKEMCLLETASWLSGGLLADNPSCVSLVIAAFGMYLNDAWRDEERQLLLPYAEKIIGTAYDGQDAARSYLAADWLVRDYLPAMLDAGGKYFPTDANALRNLSPIVNVDSVRSAFPMVSDVRARCAQVRSADTHFEDWCDAYDLVDGSSSAAYNAIRCEFFVGTEMVTELAEVTRLAAWEIQKHSVRPMLDESSDIIKNSTLELLDKMINPIQN